MSEITFPKITFTEFKKHFLSFLDLFLKPRQQWKKTLSNRLTNRTILIDYMLYLILLVVVIFKHSFVLSFQIVVFDLLTCILPFLIYLVPYTINVRKNKKRLKWQNLFKLLIVMKIQLAVTILILYFFVLWFDSEFIFALMFNAGSVYWIATILFPPLLLKLSISRKIIWIALNYLFLNFSFVIFGFLPKLDLSKALYTLYSRDEDYRKENPNFEKDYFTNIGQAITPNEEYQNFKKLHPYNLYNPTKYVVVAHLKNDSLFIFASLYYSHFLEDTIVPFINKNLNPSLKGVKVPLKNVGAIFNNKIIPLKTFENIRTSFNSELAEYKENVDLFRKEALFDSNKNYFEMVYENINSFESMNSNDSIIRKIAKENPKLISTIPSDSSLFYCIVDLEPKYYPENTLQIEEMENKFFWRDFMTNLLMRIILTPAAIFHSLVNVFLN